MVKSTIVPGFCCICSLISFAFLVKSSQRVLYEACYTKHDDTSCHMGQFVGEHSLVNPPDPRQCPYLVDSPCGSLLLALYIVQCTCTCFTFRAILGTSTTNSRTTTSTTWSDNSTAAMGPAPVLVQLAPVQRTACTATDHT